MNKSEFDKAIHKLIPGGAHTYTKGDDQFPSNAPSGIIKGLGAWIWDIEGNKFLDCSMGLGSVTLGHAFKPILEPVIKQLYKGVNFQRASYYELDVAKSFLDLLPNQDMIKFAKNGSTVTTAAVKLARSFTGRDGVAFPFDHPFYSYDDWFIGSTKCNKGVPNSIKELSYTFQSCNTDSLKELFKNNPDKIACVIMEPQKFTCKSGCKCKLSVEEYLKKAIEICHKNGAIFILDEMVSGFKFDFPGASSRFNIKPDMITWGKGISNGFSCSVLTGIREIMDQGSIKNTGKEKVFLTSTTHGAETHALIALKETIKIYKEKNIIESIHSKGKKIISLTRDLISKYRLNNYIEVSESYWTPLWIFHSKNEKNNLAYKTFFMQEMIKNGVLFQGIIVPSFSHGVEEIKFFLKAFEDTLIKYSLLIKNNNINEVIDGEVIKPVFRKIL